MEEPQLSMAETFIYIYRRAVSPSRGLQLDCGKAALFTLHQLHQRVRCTLQGCHRTQQ